LAPPAWPESKLMTCRARSSITTTAGSLSLSFTSGASTRTAIPAPFETFSAEALREHEHRFPASSFVRETVGVGSVSGPVAWLLSQGNLSGETLREQGVTITLGVTH
uniref:cobalamin biosynthesis protein n=1 Tax=Klebsiella pneumoniae TaxID=573 RepID=UPI003F6714E6